MRTNKILRQKSKIIYIALATAILLILLGFLFFILEKNNIINLLKDNDTNTKDIIESNIDYNKPSKDQIDAGNEIKKGSNDQVTSPGDDFNVIISSLYSDNELLHIRATINGIISNSGTCELTIQDLYGNEQKSLVVDTFAMPSYTTCQGFDIYKSEISSNDITVILTVKTEDKTSTVEQEYRME